MPSFNKGIVYKPIILVQFMFIKHTDLHV